MNWINIYNNNYAVSDTGLVRANERIIDTVTGKRKYKERILKPETTNDGHLRVVLSENGEKNRVFVHRLVAEAFISNPNNYPIINHKDENPANNNMDNLEWCTYSYNNNYNERNKKIGEKEGTTISIYTINNEYIETLPSITAFANKYGYPLSTCWRRSNDNKPIGKYILKKRNEQ